MNRLNTPAIISNERRRPFSSGLSDDDIVRRILSGEPPLFEALMRRYNQTLYRIAYGVVGRSEDAEDVLQETWGRAYRALEQYAGGNRLPRWLGRIAVHEATDRIRLRSAEHRRIERFEAMARRRTVRVESPARALIDAEFREALEAAITGLPRDQRVVFLLREMEDLSTRSTAELLGVSEEVVKVRLHRARARLRSGLRAHDPARTAGGFRFLGERCDAAVRAVFEKLGIALAVEIEAPVGEGAAR